MGSGITNYFYEFLPEIPKNQCFVNRPELGKIFTEGVLRDRGRRDRKVEGAVERHGYTRGGGGGFSRPALYVSE